MKKAELIEMLQKELSKHDVVDVLAKAIVKSGKISILGFGTFSVKQRAARMGVNPSNGEKIKIKAKKVITFKASKAIKVK